MRKRRFISVLLAMCFVAGLTFAGAQDVTEKTSSANIMLDGKLLELDAEAVTCVDGRTMVSAGDFFDAIGADYAPGEESATATLGDVSVTFAEDSDVLTVKRGDASWDLQTDVAPALEDGGLAVPVRAVSEALGLSVSWDSGSRTVVLIDFAKLLGDIDSKYGIFNELSQMALDPGKAYKITADLTQKTTGEEAGKPVETNLTGAIEAIFKGIDMSMVYTIHIDPGDALKEAADSAGELQAGMLDLMQNMQIKLIYNSADEVLYINIGELGEIISEGLNMTGFELTKDTWIKLDLTDYIDMAGEYAEDFHKLAKGDLSWLTMGRILDMCLNHSDIYAANSYNQICFGLEFVGEIMSDKAFIKAGPESTPTYRYSLDQKKLEAAFKAAKAKYPIDESISSFFDMMIKYVKFDVSLEIQKTGEYSSVMTMKYTFNSDESAEGGQKIGITMDMKGEAPGKSAMKQSMDMQVGDVKMSSAAEMTMNIEETGEQVPSAPPKDAKILDLNEIINALMMAGMAQAFLAS